MWHHIKPILQVIIFATVMLVSSIHRAILENTNVPYFLISSYHTTKLQLIAKNISTHTRWILILSMKKIKSLSCFCCLSLYCAIQKGNQTAGQNHGCVPHCANPLYSTALCNDVVSHIDRDTLSRKRQFSR